MARLRLVHWNEGEAAQRATRLEALGYEVDGTLPDRTFLAKLQRWPPAGLVIDLSRLPSQGRDMAVAVRTKKILRSVPLVFVDGAVEKVERVRKLLPDATFTRWESIAGSLQKALRRRPYTAPAPPGGAFAGYSGTPLPRKLGIKAGSVVNLVGAPPDFEQTLGDLPAGAELRRRARGKCDLVIWFVKACKELERRIVAMGELGDALWVAWPKKASGVPTDLTQKVVRRVGLASGLVDYKICAIDTTWSGLKFTGKKPT